jgi:polyisoprenoid-binding protein YceI
MNRRNLSLIFAALTFMGIGAGVGVLGWIFVTGGSSDPSEPISAPTLDLNAEPTYSQTQAAELAMLATENANTIAQLATENAQLQQANEDAQAADPATEIPATPEQTEAPASEEASGAEGRVLFRISPPDSEARFVIDEILQGSPNTVVGATQEVAGDIIVNFDNPSLSTIGTIRINARNLRTDNEFRNRTLRSTILESNKDEYEFAEFVPVSLENVSTEPAEVGATLEFQITGDLTVKETTRSVTFDATVTLVSADRIEGLATTTVLYQDFNLSIPPNIPGVTGITDEVNLEIEFVATQVDS